MLLIRHHYSNQLRGKTDKKQDDIWTEEQP